MFVPKNLPTPAPPCWKQVQDPQTPTRHERPPFRLSPSSLAPKFHHRRPTRPQIPLSSSTSQQWRSPVPDVEEPPPFCNGCRRAGTGRESADPFLPPRFPAAADILRPPICTIPDLIYTGSSIFEPARWTIWQENEGS